MKCQQAQDLLHAYVDEELDLSAQVLLDTHLQSCVPCATQLQAVRGLRTAMQGATLGYRAPAELTIRIQQQIKKESTPHFFNSPHRFAIAASWIVVAVVSWQAALFVATPSVNELYQQDVINNHVRSLLANHVTDILSADQHTVKPWFVGKLDFSPLVVDLTTQGFPLLGGRLDYLGGRPVAALVYTRRQHVINVFIRPRDPLNVKTAVGHAPLALAAQHGYHLVAWQHVGVDYWAISDLNEQELAAFAQLFANTQT